MNWYHTICVGLVLFGMGTKQVAHAAGADGTVVARPVPGLAPLLKASTEEA
jgi:hypothetical protein